MQEIINRTRYACYIPRPLLTKPMAIWFVHERELGNKPGNETGNETGNKPGNETGNEAGNKPGNEAGNETGNEAKMH